MPEHAEAAIVELKIPGSAEFVGVIRLAILGVASRMRFSYDEVEDIRLAVGEACATAIERAEAAGAPPAQISVRCRIDPGKLTIEVCDPSPSAEDDPPSSSAPNESEGEPSLGSILIRILMDDVQWASEHGRPVLRMVKFVTAPAEVPS